MSTILRGPYTVAPDATWTDAAASWPVVVEERLTDPAQLGPEGLRIVQDDGWLYLTEPVPQLHLCCARCDSRPSLLCLSPGTGEPYQVTVADMLSGILAHLRRSHEHVVAS